MDTQEKIKDLRDRILAGEEPPQEELKECLSAYRQEREAASNKKTAKKEKREKVATMELGDLFAKKKPEDK